MKRSICLIFMIVGIAAVAFAPAASTAASAGGSVTGIGSGSFPGGADFAGTNLRSFEMATGVFTEPDGSAAGVFHTVLTGRTILGQAKSITVEGNVTQGTVSPGSGSFSGLASVDFGDGAPAVPGVPFNVETSAGSMVLTIQSTRLPAAALSGGSLTIE
jgi:hypothetical protein